MCSSLSQPLLPDFRGKLDHSLLSWCSWMSHLGENADTDCHSPSQLKALVLNALTQTLFESWGTRRWFTDAIGKDIKKGEHGVMMMTSAEGRGCRAERKWGYVQYLNHVLVQVQMRSLPLFRTRALPTKPPTTPWPSNLLYTWPPVYPSFPYWMVLFEFPMWLKCTWRDCLVIPWNRETKIRGSLSAGGNCQILFSFFLDSR